MRYVITIDLESDAFTEPEGNWDPSYEIERILRDAAERVKISGVEDLYLRDSNGNTVGHARLVPDPSPDLEPAPNEETTP